MEWKADIKWLNEVFDDPIYTEIIGRGLPLTDSSLEILLDISEEMFCSKDEILEAANTFSNYIYIIKSGSLRAHYLKDGNEITSWFAFEKHFVFTTSFITGKPSVETLETMEDCKLLAINLPALMKEYGHNLELANWGRRFAELGMVYVETQLYDLKFHSAQERYLRLIESQPEIIQRCKLGYIASYLGVTQVTLSRIRSSLT
ncbi:MAG: Crp/Fnr family transcriptional regulator [Bacteroidales bacterium]